MIPTLGVTHGVILAIPNLILILMRMAFVKAPKVVKFDARSGGLVQLSAFG